MNKPIPNSRFQPPFGWLRGNAQGSSMAHWKAHCRRLPISDNWTFSLALTTEALLSEICRNRRFLKGGHFERKFLVGGDVARNPSLWTVREKYASSFHTTKLCSRLLSTDVEFYWQNSKIAFCATLWGDLGVTYTVHIQLVGKRVVDFLLALIEHFSLTLMVEALWADIGRNRCVRKGLGHYECKFQG